MKKDAKIGIAPLFMLMLLVALLVYLWQLVGNWQTLAHPYRYLMAFYYVLIVLPLEAVVPIWHWASQLTGYPNLNLVLKVLFSALYVVTLPLAAAAGLWHLAGRWRGYLPYALLAPGALALFWWVMSGVIGWLFAR